MQPIKWTGAIEGDSVKLTATIEKGWHLNIIELGDGFYMDEYEGTFTKTVAKADTIRVRYNACDDKMCTAPETWEYVTLADNQSPVTDGEASETQSIWVIFLMGLLGGLLAGGTFLPDVNADALVSFPFLEKIETLTFEKYSLHFLLHLHRGHRSLRDELRLLSVL